MTRRLWMAAAALALAAAGCADSPSTTAREAEREMKVSTDVWAKVDATRFFFGHQSVGENILDGVRELATSAGNPNIRIHDSARGAVPAGPALIHAHIGQNGDPLSKIRAFREAMDAGMGKDVDIAAFKFCFWDIRSQTDVGQVFAEYERTMTDLRQRYPGVRFVHVTVPLFARDDDWKAGVRRLLRMPVSRTLDNARREELSERIRTRYQGKEPVFDLAGLESSGLREQDVPYMDPGLTDDGGHLNEPGRARLAAAFLEKLAEAGGSDGSTASRP